MAETQAAVATSLPCPVSLNPVQRMRVGVTPDPPASLGPTSLRARGADARQTHSYIPLSRHAHAQRTTLLLCVSLEQSLSHVGVGGRSRCRCSLTRRTWGGRGGRGHREVKALQDSQRPEGSAGGEGGYDDRMTFFFVAPPPTPHVTLFSITLGATLEFSSPVCVCESEFPKVHKSKRKARI